MMASGKALFLVFLCFGSNLDSVAEAATLGSKVGAKEVAECPTDSTEIVAACKCGTGAECETGQVCTTNVCHAVDIGECPNSDGKEENKASCFCGAAKTTVCQPNAICDYAESKCGEAARSPMPASSESSVKGSSSGQSDDKLKGYENNGEGDASNSQNIVMALGAFVVGSTIGGSIGKSSSGKGGAGGAASPSEASGSGGKKEGDQDATEEKGTEEKEPEEKEPEEKDKALEEEESDEELPLVVHHAKKHLNKKQHKKRKHH